MTSDARADSIRLADILRAIDRVESFLKEGYESFFASWRYQDAVIRELEVIGEAAGKISSALRSSHPEIGWREMRGFASFAKHDYWKVKPDRLWEAVREMPLLRKKLGQVKAKQ